MYIEFVPNRNSRPTVLLREAWREGGKVRKRTIANLTGWSDDKINTFKLLLRGEPLIHPSEAFVIEQSLPCGHVHAILKLIEKIGLKDTLGHGSKLSKNIVIAMVIHALFIQNAPNMADCLWHGTTIIDDMGLHNVMTADVSGTLEWLMKRKKQIESLVEPGNGPMATAPYENGMLNIARSLIHLMADHVNMNLHRVLTPLLSFDTIHEDVCTRLVRKEHPLSLHAKANLHEANMQGGQGHALSLFEVVEHLAARCRITLRIASIPGGMIVNLCTPASPLQARVFELIEAYDGKGPVIETSSWHRLHQKGTVHVPAELMGFPDRQNVPVDKDMDRSLSETET